MEHLLKPCIEYYNQHVGCLLHARKNMNKMNHAMKLLNAKKSDVIRRVKDAERKKEKPTDEVNCWLEEVAKLEDQVQTVQADYNKIGPSHPYHLFPPTAWWSIQSCGRRAADFKEEAEKLVLERAGIVALTEPRGPDCVEHIAGPSNYVGKAIERNLEIVRRYLEDATVRVVGIWGPGGVGKTTLMRKINNSLKDDENFRFDYVIWVVASQEHNLEKLQKDIATRLGLSSPSQIFDFLKDKNFLLLLDDLWEHFDVNDVGIPGPSCHNGKNQKVVLTTRSDGVRNRMLAYDVIKVECLEPEEALELFREAVGKMTISGPGIESLVEDVANECDGLPIALKAIGKAMSGKKKLEQWEDALNKLRTHTGDIKGLDRVFSCLRISYDSLEDERERECFLHCSLWPEDDRIGEEELIWCWLGHGLIDAKEFETLDAALNRGHSIIENLKEASLLEDSGWTDSLRTKKAVKMHDMIRDLALRVVRERKSKWIVKVVDAGRAIQASFEWEGAEKTYIRLTGSDQDNFGLRPAQQCCSTLSTLFLRQDFGSLKTDFLRFMRKLRYLDLSHCRIQELPAVIGGLSELEYLNLSDTGIRELPDDLANLIKLKFLFLADLRDPIRITIKLILRLEKLLVLDAETGVLETNEDDDVEKFYMTLCQMKLLSVKEFKILSLGALENLSHVTVLHLPHVKVQLLHISNLRTLKTFHLQVLTNNSQEIKSLQISDCLALEEIVMADSCLPCLTFLLLSGLPKLREINWSRERPSVCLPVLDTLVIQKCRELKNVSWVMQLPRLWQLKLSHCDGMEYIIAAAKEANPTFLSLKELYLDGLPKLNGICHREIDFPSLSKVDVIDCPELKRLPFKILLADIKVLLADADMNDLVIAGTQEWWDGLSWADERIKSALQHRFQVEEEEPAEEE